MGSSICKQNFVTDHHSNCIHVMIRYSVQHYDIGCMIIEVTAAWRPKAAQPGLAYWSLTLYKTCMLGHDSNGNYL